MFLFIHRYSYDTFNWNYVTLFDDIAVTLQQNASSVTLKSSITTGLPPFHCSHSILDNNISGEFEFFEQKKVDKYKII